MDANELEASVSVLEPAVLAGLRTAIANVKTVARAQVRDETVAVELPEGHTVEVVEHPVRRAAVYVPGGRAPYPSTVVMGAVTARVAGVEQVVEEAHAGLALAGARPVEVERQLDVGLAGGAMDLRGAAHARRSMDSACRGKLSARASAAPWGARRAAASPGKDTRDIRRLNVAGDSAD